MNKEGYLLACAKEPQDSTTTGALISTIWCDYEANGPVSDPENQLEGDEMNMMILQGEEGKIVVGPIGMLCLCVQGVTHLGRLVETFKKVHSILEPSLISIVGEANA